MNQSTDAAPIHAHPRPMLVRDNWHSLDGEWAFAFDPDATITDPEAVTFEETIRVPFAPEAPLSGLAERSKEVGKFRRVWYRRSFTPPALGDGHRLLLHFAAADYHARVYVNGKLVVEHEGGYTPFGADITDHLDGSGEQTVVVCCDDDPTDLTQPRGKQCWTDEPSGIFYWRTTGIWQTVWLEVVPATRLDRLRWTPDRPNGLIELDATLFGPARSDCRLRVRLSRGERVLVDDTLSVDAAGRVRRQLAVCSTSVNFRDTLDLDWKPGKPRLIDATLELLDAAGNVVDRVQSYTALRDVRATDNAILVSEQRRKLRLVLDQGYWPDGGMTPPSDEAIKRDIELTLAMGFDGVRKHQKIEHPRFLYWADQLGMVVWEELPSVYTFEPRAVTRAITTWTEAIERDVSHPCIIAWVPINESWGVADLATDARQRDFCRTLYRLTRALDGTRPVIGNDGWELVESDVTALHDYTRDVGVFEARWDLFDDDDLRALLATYKVGARDATLDGYDPIGKPVLLTEFGGIAFSAAAGTWGYGAKAAAGDELAHNYAELCRVLNESSRLAGFCYTQLTDVYQEANGLLTMEREAKFDIEQIRRATRGGQ